MTDPKMALTKFSDVYRAKSAVAVAVGELGAVGDGGAGGGGVVEALAVGPRFREMAVALATSGSVREQDEATLVQIQTEYSISSVEELVALSRVDRKRGGKLLARVGIKGQTVKQLTASFSKTAGGEEELSDWSRYERFEYNTGLELDLDNPPPDEPAAFGAIAAPAGFGAPAPGGPQPPGPPPPPQVTVSLIDTYMSAIRDQGLRGTCTAFAGVACLEYYQRRFGGHTSDLSEQFAYWNMVTNTGGHALVPMFQRLQADGTCTEFMWPYYRQEIAGNDAQGEPPPGAIDQARAYRPKAVLQIAPRDVGAIRSAIAGFHPVAIGIPVFPSWYESAVVRKYGNITVPLPGEVPEKIGHAITLVGFEDNPDYAGGGYFIVRNSWGHNWATAGVFGPGYGTIPYRYIANFNWDAWHVAA
jgi:hypothetical protein